MSAGRALFQFVMERDGRAPEVRDWDDGFMHDDVKATWEAEAEKIVVAAELKPIALVLTEEWTEGCGYKKGYTK